MHILLPILGYLLGSIPVGVLVGKIAGRDPREGGSGNLGASNVTRTLGKEWGALTLFLDAAKAALPTGLAWWWVDLDAACVTGALAVIGHCWPVWLRFKGGRGVASTFGVMAVIAPVIAILGVLAWAVALRFTRIPTVGSVLASVLFVILARVDTQPFAVQVFTLISFGVILVRHAQTMRALKDRLKAQKRHVPLHVRSKKENRKRRQRQKRNAKKKR